MDNNYVKKMVKYFKSCSDENKLIIIYRYASLLATSLFLFFNDLNISIYKKVLIIACVSVSSVILNYLYINNDESAFNIIHLIVIETIGISVLLVPSGGINSPYLLYSLNTILIATLKLNKKYFCWIILFFYFIALIVIYYAVFQSNQETFLNLINKESNIILSLILITVVSQIMSKHLKTIENNFNKINESNKQLSAANIKVKETINYVMDLYQAIHLFITQNDRNNLIDIITTYTQKITNTNIVLFYDCLKQEDKITIKADNLSEELNKKFKEAVLRICNLKGYFEEYVQVMVDNKSLILFPVKSTYKNYGILAVETFANKEEGRYRENLEQMTFLSELSSIVFEKFEIEKVKDRFLIIEEQNRIANELHDSVIQRLFSTSAGIYKVMKSCKNTANEEIGEELSSIQNAIDSTMRELRSTIYSLSSEKNSEKTFESDIKKYICEISRLNSVEVILKIKGMPEQLNLLYKKAFYRIICEGIGNAVRHGKASKIKVDFDIKRDFASLEICDNGIGFNTKEITCSKTSGLGLKNIQALAHMMKGELRIESKIREGSVISVNVPSICQGREEEVL